MQFETIVFIPISRHAYLPDMIACLERLQCDTRLTSLLMLVDGDMELYKRCREYADNAQFNDVLVAPFNGKGAPYKNSASHRRKRIADIHNYATTIMKSSDFVFGVEDDTLFPPDSLERLMKDYINHPDAGMIEGVELGRWRNPYVGAWLWDDVQNPTAVGSITLPREPTVMPIDSGGFYCYLTRGKTFTDHTYAPLFNGSFGPDLEWSLALRKRGLQNYIDTGIICEHMDERSGGIIEPHTTLPKVVKLKLKNKSWRFV